MMGAHEAWFIAGNVATVVTLGAWLDSRSKKWAKENIVRPITQNGGKNNPPTLPDRLHAQDETLARIEGKVDAHGAALNKHLGWSESETDRRKQVEGELWGAINEMRLPPK